MGYYVDAEVFYGVRVYSELPEPIDEYRSKYVFGRSTGCAASGNHKAEWLYIGDSRRPILEERQVHHPVVINECFTGNSWDEDLLAYAQEIGVKVFGFPGWVVVSSGG